MISRFGESEVVMLSDRTDAGAIDDAILDDALVGADAEIDAYLSGRYTTPVAASRMLQDIACDITRYRLCGGPTPVTEEIRARYKDAIGFLSRVADGRANLGGAADAGEQAEHLVEISTGAKLFGRGKGGLV
ncbi:DUF1320 domain-containing protein [Denitromonas halophila]|uniref:DUF1320 domain-containing protein n=2 Tax=Denitromonas halophila TaxID=1629404 RepID=A0A557QYB1_9RHOO|nr:DUF1320 domain-containing protein [Denitromonas halophila]